MTDRREEILSRLLVILTAVPPQVGSPVHTVFRNRGELPDDKRPSIVLLDGGETIKTPYGNKGRVLMSPAVMTLRPQIFLLLQPRKTIDNAGVGAELNLFRKAIIKAIANDQDLTHLCGSNGGIQLDSCETDMQTGSTLTGEMRFDFSIDYMLDPYNL